MVFMVFKILKAIRSCDETQKSVSSIFGHCAGVIGDYEDAEYQKIASANGALSSRLFPFETSADCSHVTE